MNDILTNQLNMIGACIATATTPEHMLVWNGQEPADFAADLNVFQTHYGQARDVAYLAGSATTGSANAKDVAETALENLAFQMARALAGHYKKSGNLINRAKVNIRLGALQKLRDQALVTRSIEIRDLANSATAEPGASTRGITTARINFSPPPSTPTQTCSTAPAAPSWTAPCTCATSPPASPL